MKCWFLENAVSVSLANWSRVVVQFCLYFSNKLLEKLVSFLRYCKYEKWGNVLLQRLEFVCATLPVLLGTEA